MTTIYTDRPPQFWQDMGPFFASADIRKDLPSLSDKPGAVWFVVYEGSLVVAFASIDVDERKVGHLRNLYVVPDQRGAGYASTLMKERLDYLRDQGVTKARTSRRVSKEIHFAETHGFSVKRIESGWEILEADLAMVPAPPARVPNAAAVEAGRIAAIKKMGMREKAGKKYLRARPAPKEYAAWAGEHWEDFTAGWVAAVKARFEEATTW